ncbi:MAG: tRNA pseudouridine(38-40) synthase TruA, partial [Prevotellaceae bacterium]|nr:tRNA pseudouridine(38-40) synthase TruA [Prevotellaceae bacterium]
YDGGRYHGWQIQPNGISVQEVLTQALTTALQAPTTVTGAGRTDTGVHARLMVAHFDHTEELETEVVATKLNRMLPADIGVYRIRKVKPDAHARFDAISRTYHYYITLRKDPFLRAYSYYIHRSLDFVRMNEAAQTLFEYTDFTSFSKLHTDVKTNDCRIMTAEWVQTDTYTWRFTIQADRFLRNMVRAIVGTLIEVGAGKLSVSDFRKVIERRDRCAAGMSVPGQALFLVDIAYPAE